MPLLCPLLVSVGCSTAGTESILSRAVVVGSFTPRAIMQINERTF